MVGAAGPLRKGFLKIQKARNRVALFICAVRFRVFFYLATKGSGPANSMRTLAPCLRQGAKGPWSEQALVGHNRAEGRVVQQVAAQA